MDVNKVQEQLLKKDYDKVEVTVYCNYLVEAANEQKDGKYKNWWLRDKVTDGQLVAIYQKVANDKPLFIDGETITLGYRGGKLKVVYDYHAYKNRLMSKYPESVLDFELVHKGDKFTFKKDSGKVIYKHDIVDPFNTEKEIVGAYGIIKNSRGEFIEVLTMDDIKKMRAVSTMDKIWQTWFDRMVYKSIIKRSCSAHFYDIFQNIEQLDNENYELENVQQIDREEVFDKIATFTELQELLDWASDEELSAFHNDQAFRKAVHEKKVELEAEEGKEASNE